MTRNRVRTGFYEEQLQSLNFVPGFKLLPRIPFQSLKFSILIPGYFLEMVQRESPDCTSCTLEGSLGIEIGFGFGELLATALDFVAAIGFRGYMVKRCPILRLLLRKPFQRFIWLTPTP